MGIAGEALLPYFCNVNIIDEMILNAEIVVNKLFSERLIIVEDLL